MPFMKASCINDDKLKTETKRNRTHTPRAYYLIQFVCLFLSIMYVVQIGINSYCTVLTSILCAWDNHGSNYALIKRALRLCELSIGLLDRAQPNMTSLSVMLCKRIVSTEFIFDILGEALKWERTEISRNTCKSKLAINLVSLWCAMDSYVHFLLLAPIPVRTSR